ncbi:FAD-dependent oxidoreductase [Prevotella sp. HUN102]|uniref:FAD-dependent oxidoreductase n=1 Tax=Prevotella sp. HUN102 TaxID=1392486 RepID=UPI00048A93B1|nr:FAD-dependent oxidoreductase [Prevotella sp. HUN102]
MKHIIIGGVAGGATTAARIRRADETAEIVLMEKGKYISYANCGLPYYIGGVIAERENLFVQTPESFGKRFNIDVRTENEVLSIDTEKKTVCVRRADGTEYEESYDKLLLSPGSTPVRPPLPGIDLEGIYTLRNVEDTDRIKAYLETHSVKRAVVVGGGFIGLEMAENLAHAGAVVSIVEMGNQVMAPIDFSMAAHVHRHLEDKGVRLYLEKGVSGFEKKGDAISVQLNDGSSLEADMVLLSIGVRPSTTLAKCAGIELGEKGIKVDKYLQTSAKDVYAVGDAIEYEHPLTGQPWLNYLAGPANRQGRIVADNMVFGNKTEYEGAIGTSIAKVFDLTVASTGLPAKRLKQLNIDYKSSTTVSASHAGYYPGAFQITLKLTFHPQSGLIYGAQAVGVDGVDKRIDVLAQMIKNKKTVYDLVKMEQAYAPPFSSAKDPVTIAGYVASNIISGAMKPIYWREVRDLDRTKSMFIDVSTPAEYELRTIEGAVNIPLDDLRERINEVPKNKEVVVFCAVGLRGYLAQRILMGRGYTNVRNLSGGYRHYAMATAPIKANEEEPKIERNRKEEKMEETKHTLRVNACGLQCPGPIMKLKNTMDGMNEGERVEIKATDAGFPRDAQAWCKTTGNNFISKTDENGLHTVIIEKAKKTDAPMISGTAEKNKTLIMFSDDLDKALATFVLANGAAATGHKVSIFFTFWGLNVIKKEQKPAVSKDIFGRMFSWMLPSSSKKLSLSKMSMMGIGDSMMRHIMKKRGINQLEELRQQALDNGVEFIACQMSMDMMGVDRRELLDNVTVGGVATYMERAEEANVNLFI